MTREDVISKLVIVMEDVFDLDDLDYADNLTAGDIPEWDSLSHVRLMVAVERAFAIRFTSSEIEDFKVLGDLVTAIAAKAAG
ncbi:acyl carrier protein [Sphingomonas sp. PAMC 26621]|uniref:acyl carrier protein n=1 Tax=Sphingomonas sp. PAMC 26621 TaxID=1112213 RepID=UPI000315DED9|nr:acyl carrier protein [Sphingomonas sp. PAMC 26621]